MGAGHRVAAAFETFPGGSRLVTEWVPEHVAPTRTLLLLPPFAEELNKSRRALAQSARAFAQRGFAVCVADLKGTGDSEGEFGEARWTDWIEDLRHLLRVLPERHGAPVTLWGLRAGALFLPDLDATGLDLLLWQPVTSGETVLTQWLRLKVANDKLAGREGSGTRDLRARLEAGESLEIAGYDLHPDLVLPLARANLQTWNPGSRRIQWIETGAEPSGNPGPASQRVIDQWRSAGADVAAVWVQGEQFWLTTEIAENTGLCTASLPVPGGATG